MVSRFHRNCCALAGVTSIQLSLPRRRVSRWVIAVLCAASSVPLTCTAQQAGGRNTLEKGFPFANPQEFFKQFFGGQETEEERKEIELIPISLREERRIGQEAVEAYLAELRRTSKVTDRGKDVEYLRKLVNTLRPMMKNGHRYRAIRIYIVDSEKTDARSFPGGTLFIFRGMLELAGNEAALVGVLGHELSHLDREHQLYDAKRMKLAQKTFNGAGTASPDQFLRNGMMLLRSFSRPFRPEDESDADADGVQWAYKAGYDPREMARLFLRMSERNRFADTAPAFLRTHPYSVDRYQAALDLYEQLQAGDPREDLYIGVKNLAERVPKSDG